MASHLWAEFERLSFLAPFTLGWGVRYVLCDDRGGIADRNSAREWTILAHTEA